MRGTPRRPPAPTTPGCTAPRRSDTRPTARRLPTRAYAHRRSERNASRLYGPGLDAHQVGAVEAGDVDAGRVVPGLERLDERGPGAGERIENEGDGGDVAIEHRLDELRHELAEIRMQTVDVLRPLALGQIRSPTTRARGRASPYSASWVAAIGPLFDARRTVSSPWRGRAGSPQRSGSSPQPGRCRAPIRADGGRTER